jgi:subfamily B ATP-binding cassette protein MsbA
MKDIKRILLLVKPYWGRLVVAGLCSVVVSGLSGSLAWLVKPAVDKVFVSREPTFLVLLSLGVMGAYLGRGIFSFFHSYLMRSAGAKVVRDIRNRLYRHMLYLPMSYLHRDSTGAMVSKVINDAGFVQGLLSYTIKDIFVESGSVVVLVCVAMYRRWDLTLMSIIVLPVALYFVSRLSRRLKGVSRRTQEKIEEITQMLTETFTGNKIIKSFGREEDEMKRFSHRNQDFYREVMRSQRIIEATSLMMEIVGGFGIAFVLWYGGSLVIRGAITAGDFFSFLAAIFLIYTPARRLVSANNSLHQASAPLDRIDNLLKEAVEADGNIALEGFRDEIVFDNISFRYEGTDDDAVNSVSLAVKKGEIVALVGRSGAGKTTFVDLLPKFYRPVEGRILIDGVDIAKVTLKSLRSLIGIVSQDVILFNDTVRANIVYGKPDASEEELLNAAKAAYADDFIAQLPSGYETEVGERGVRLSGGQKQRLSIARAILKNPPILILDEATSSLDTASEIMVQRALENLMNDRTAFVIAHRLSTVRRASRIVVMDKGRIVECGTHEELLASGGIYKKLYSLQFDDAALEQLEAESAASAERPL